MQLLKRLVELDCNLLTGVIGFRSRPGLTPVALFVSHSGDGYLQVLCILVAGTSGNPIAREFAVLLLGLFLVERFVYLCLKNLSRRERPPKSFPDIAALVKASDKFSFPSGHTSAAFLFAACVVSVWPAAGVFALFWAMCVGVSRVFLGVHYPSDIVAGALLGVSIFSLSS